jgi:hypothetical protein
LLLGSNTTIAQLHRILQIAFAWGGEHLHRFRIHGKDYGIAYLGGISFKDDPKQVRLFEFGLRCRECFRYDYDFVANWNFCKNPLMLLFCSVAPQLPMIDNAQHQKRPVALYAEGIKWLNWAVEMLEGKKTEFHGVQVKLPAKEGK